MSMSWNDLRDWIDSLTPEQRRTTPTVFLEHADEYFPVTSTGIFEKSGGVFDQWHPVMILEE